MSEGGATRIFTKFIGVVVMSGVSTMQNLRHPKSEMPAEEGSLLAELTCGDVDRQRVAAAFVRVMYKVRADARQAGTTLIVAVDGRLMELDPDSPLLADVSELIPIVTAGAPIPEELEPPGFV
jgi:hypothetical protein